jgi:hypothetical protein
MTDVTKRAAARQRRLAAFPGEGAPADKVRGDSVAAPRPEPAGWRPGTVCHDQDRISQPAWLKLSPHQRREAIERLDAVVDVARTFGVDRATLYRMRVEANE